MQTNAEKHERAAELLKSMGNRIRVAIIELLAYKRMSVKEIHKALKLQQAIVSHHLNNLKNKGALNSEREGKNTYYSVRHTNIIAAINLILKI
jgi:DNA-binding transcriptional ArsR family regulator